MEIKGENSILGGVGIGGVSKGTRRFEVFYSSFLETIFVDSDLAFGFGFGFVYSIYL